MAVSAVAGVEWPNKKKQLKIRKNDSAKLEREGGEERRRGNEYREGARIGSVLERKEEGKKARI